MDGLVKNEAVKLGESGRSKSESKMDGLGLNWFIQSYPRIWKVLENRRSWKRQCTVHKV